MPREQLGDQGDGEGLECPVARYKHGDDPWEIAGNKNWEGDTIEITTFVKDRVEGSTSEEERGKGEEVSPVLVNLARLQRKGARLAHRMRVSGTWAGWRSGTCEDQEHVACH